jgi:hypothetical protein
MVQARKLDADEQKLAKSVYGDTLPFDRIYITDLDLGGAVTLAGMDLSTRKFDYTINWVDAYGGVTRFPDRRATLIHELCHVWQGENGVWPTFYMGQSLWHQLWAGLRDMWDKREWRGWGTHRSQAYKFSAGDVGKNWNTFNVEQQASIVESWFMPENDRFVVLPHNMLRVHHFGDGIYGGGASRYDARFPYISDVIRAKSPGAAYKAITLPAGSDPQIKAIQDTLVALGFLEARHADGVVGRGRSATLDAVAAFQRRNGLTPDRDLGGPHSDTRKKLAQSINTLNRVK